MCELLKPEKFSFLVCITWIAEQPVDIMEMRDEPNNQASGIQNLVQGVSVIQLLEICINVWHGGPVAIVFGSNGYR